MRLCYVLRNPRDNSKAVLAAYSDEVWKGDTLTHVKKEEAAIFINAEECVPSTM